MNKLNIDTAELSKIIYKLATTESDGISVPAPREITIVDLIDNHFSCDIPGYDYSDNQSYSSYLEMIGRITLGSKVIDSESGESIMSHHKVDRERKVELQSIRSKLEQSTSEIETIRIIDGYGDWVEYIKSSDKGWIVVKEYFSCDRWDKEARFIPYEGIREEAFNSLLGHEVELSIEHHKVFDAAFGEALDAFRGM